MIRREDPMSKIVLPLLLLLPPGLVSAAQGDAAATPAGGPAAAVDAWTAADVEHLMNRAGFGVRSGEARELVALGRAGLVERLLTGGAPRGEYFVEKAALPGADRAMAPEERQKLRREQRRRDTAQIADFSGYWLERMLAGDDPLREKMTLFWHGHFATSQQTVKDSYAMIRQNQLFYAHALASFGDLVHGIVRDPAMLKYLDNDQNRKGKPNENLARELMELFTLGEGHYGERDVKEAARALTGWSQRGGDFRAVKRQHDPRPKSVLGAVGNLDGDGLADLLLAQEACGPHVAGKILAFFEGAEPDPARAADYGRAFAASGYDVTALLRRLFNDPAFYSDTVVANRIASPIEQTVGTCRRLGIDPPSRMVLAFARVLGQTPFFPPSVKGWDGDEAWITTSSLMLRANLSGVLLGVVRAEDIVAAEAPATASMDPSDVAMEEPGELDETDEPVMDGEPAMTDAARVRTPRRNLGDLAALRRLGSLEWRPRMSLAARMKAAGNAQDGALADALIAELLAVPVGADTRAYVLDELRARRTAAGLADGALLSDRETAERILRDVAHLLLSLPEAQLN
jgi:uncharacterized protein (DUF1800 family)